MISQAIADKVWDILAEHAGADERPFTRHTFCHYVVGENYVPEFQFCGWLGFGGKVCLRDGRGWHVYYNHEDKTSDREEIQQATNNALSQVPTGKGGRMKDECQKCGQLGGKMVDFDSIAISRWICPHCIDDLIISKEEAKHLLLRYEEIVRMFAPKTGDSQVETLERGINRILGTLRECSRQMKAAAPLLEIFPDDYGDAISAADRVLNNKEKI